MTQKSTLIVATTNSICLNSLVWDVCFLLQISMSVLQPKGGVSRHAATLMGPFNALAGLDTS